MTDPCIISVAITGSVPRKKDNPAVPISITEQVESNHAAYEAGASLVHLHVRDEQENSSSDRSRFEALQDGIRQHCPDIIIQFSTGGRGRSFEQRGAMLDLRPDMASLATGWSTSRPRSTKTHLTSCARSRSRCSITASSPR